MHKIILCLISLVTMPAWCMPTSSTPGVSPSPSPGKKPLPVEMQLPNDAWMRIRGIVERPVDGKLWYARTNGLIPIDSIVSIRRQGSKINGGKVLETARDGIFLEPWSSDAVQPGDEIMVELIAPVPP